MRTGLSPTSHHLHASPPIDWQALHCMTFFHNHNEVPQRHAPFLRRTYRGPTESPAISCRPCLICARWEQHQLFVWKSATSFLSLDTLQKCPCVHWLVSECQPGSLVEI